jgi:hypothetical protein
MHRTLFVNPRAPRNSLCHAVADLLVAATKSWNAERTLSRFGFSPACLRASAVIFPTAAELEKQLADDAMKKSVGGTTW